MTSYAQGVDAARRLKILQLLVRGGGQASDDTLLTSLRQIGERQDMDREACRRLLRELAERDCVSVQMVQDTIMVAAVTERGRMAVSGDIEIGGVLSPHQGL